MEKTIRQKRKDRATIMFLNMVILSALVGSGMFWLEMHTWGTLTGELIEIGLFMATATASICAFLITYLCFRGGIFHVDSD